MVFLGNAFDILHKLSDTEQQSYSLANYFETRFGDQHLQQAYQAKLKYKHYKPAETLQQYEAELVKLVHLAFESNNPRFRSASHLQFFFSKHLDYAYWQN